MAGSSETYAITPVALTAAPLVGLIYEFRRHNPVPAPAVLRMTTRQYENLKADCAARGTLTNEALSTFSGIPIEIDDSAAGAK